MFWETVNGFSNPRMLWKYLAVCLIVQAKFYVQNENDDYEDYEETEAYDEPLPQEWNGALDEFEPALQDFEEEELYEEVNPVELKGEYQEGLYYAGKGIGSTISERMLMAAGHQEKSDQKDYSSDTSEFNQISGASSKQLNWILFLLFLTQV